MKNIAFVRESLSNIRGALKQFDPEYDYSGHDPGVIANMVSFPPMSGPDFWWPKDIPRWAKKSDFSSSNRIEELELPFNYEDFEGEREQELTTDYLDPVFEVGANVDSDFPILGGNSGQQIKRSAMQQGVKNAGGYYLSFHYTGVQWGIYVQSSGIVNLVKHALNKLPITTDQKLKLAFQSILNHELFHFATDYAIAQMELMHNEPWYLPSKKAFRRGQPDYCQQEEKLANAYMLKALNSMESGLRVKGTQALVREYTKRQSCGYNQGWKVRKEGWEKNVVELANCYLSNSKRAKSIHHIFQYGFDWPQQFPIKPAINWRYCPIFWVDDIGNSPTSEVPSDWLSFFSKIDYIDESNSFVSQMKRLPKQIKKAWERKKIEFTQAITRGMDFKKWVKGGKDVWSCRLNSSYRVHLQRKGSEWIAIEIGSHKQMGHG